MTSDMAATWRLFFPFFVCKHKLIQGWAKEWALGCVNPASWLPPAAGGEFTQPRTHSFAHLCSWTASVFARVIHVAAALGIRACLVERVDGVLMNVARECGRDGRLSPAIYFEILAFAFPEA